METAASEVRAVVNLVLERHGDQVRSEAREFSRKEINKYQRHTKKRRNVYNIARGPGGGVAALPGIVS